MDYAMLESNAISNKIGAAYVEALRDIQGQLGNIYKNFAIGVSDAEAKRILQRAPLDPDKSFTDNLRNAISLVEDPEEKARMLAELNAPAYKARMQRLKALANDAGKKCDQLAKVSEGALGGGLRGIVRDTYYRGVFDMQQRTGIAFSFSKVSERMIKEVLQQNWSGESYSSRIWSNTDALAEQLQEVLLKGVLTGASSGSMANEIQERFHASYSRALTLTRTESSHCANSAEMYRYKETGVKRYQYVATLDSRTSEICQELDGQTFPVDKAKPGTNCPPMHPNCRSTTIEELSPALMKKLERRARDPETGELRTVPGDMTYKEWKAKYVEGGELTSDLESGIIKENIIVGRSLGAASKNYPITLPDGNHGKVLEGSEITDIVVFAGKGTDNPIRVAAKLEKTYHISAEKWQKVRGTAFIRAGNTNKKAELHWYEAEGKRVEMKVKKYYEDDES